MTDKLVEQLIGARTFVEVLCSPKNWPSEINPGFAAQELMANGYALMTGMALDQARAVTLAMGNLSTELQKAYLHTFATQVAAGAAQALEHRQDNVKEGGV